MKKNPFHQDALTDNSPRISLLTYALALVRGGELAVISPRTPSQAAIEAARERQLQAARMTQPQEFS